MSQSDSSQQDRNGGNDYRDLKEKTLDICREFTRGRCSRSEDHCRFAHPPPYVEVKDGKVVICFDFTKNRCNRMRPPCRYMHPPPHLCPNFGGFADRRESRGDDRRRGGSRMGGSNYGDSMNNYRSGYDMMNQPWMGGPDYRGGGRPMYDGGDRGMYNGGGGRGMFNGGGGRGMFNGGGGGGMGGRSDQIEVCREFRRGKCDREECRYAHPPEQIRVENGYVTYCKDFVINGDCKREGCRYFHLPPHLLERYGHKSSGRNQKRSYDESFRNGGDRDESSPSAKRMPESDY